MAAEAGVVLTSCLTGGGGAGTDDGESSGVGKAVLVGDVMGVDDVDGGDVTEAEVRLETEGAVGGDSAAAGEVTEEGVEEALFVAAGEEATEAIGGDTTVA
jgi:hypothetical protein